MIEELEKRWCALWHAIGAKGDPFTVWLDLLYRYGEIGRFYHTLPHIDHSLGELDPTAVWGKCQNPLAVAFAIWLHDAENDTDRGARDNEKKSAQLALKIIREASLPESFEQKVAALILATDHKKVPVGIDEQTIADIDLSILGQPRAIFDRYERLVRWEYLWASDEEFATGRSRLLEAFLRRRRIFSTDFFLEKYEEAARANIARSLAALDKMR
jgi:predicted metal-dependent HD superfamily phosphohydrolase